MKLGETRGNWSRRSIEADKRRFEQHHAEKDIKRAAYTKTRAATYAQLLADGHTPESAETQLGPWDDEEATK